MPHSLNMNDQVNLNFVHSQMTKIETKVYEEKYPELQYKGLVPLDYSANDWAETVTYFSSKQTGQAEFIGQDSTDFPFVDMDLEKFQTGVSMAGIGYSFNLQEIMQARMLGHDLEGRSASRARHSAEEFIDKSILTGNATKGYNGLINYPGITTVAAPAGAAGAGGGFTATQWARKTVDELMLDINNLMAGIWIDSQAVAMADTLLLPPQALVQIFHKRIPNTDKTLLGYLKENNAYTMKTGKPLKIREVRGLETAGAGNTQRLVAYNRSDSVLKAHIPMRFKFLERQVHIMRYMKPGIFRFGGLDIREPMNVRYLDGI